MTHDTNDYSSLTWGQFKAMVEAAGAKDDTPIEYMDFSHPTVSDVARGQLMAHINADGDLVVS